MLYHFNEVESHISSKPEIRQFCVIMVQLQRLENYYAKLFWHEKES